MADKYIDKYIGKFAISDVVTLKTDDDKTKFIVTGIIIRPNKSILYYLSKGNENELVVYEIEIA